MNASEYSHCPHLMGLVRSRIWGLASLAPVPASSVFTERLMAECGMKAPGGPELLKPG